MKKENKMLAAALLIFGLVIIFLVIRIYSPQINITSSTSLLPIFLTGLVTGGLTCLAVQGGLLASTIAMQEEDKLKEKVLAAQASKKSGSAIPILAFLTSKLVAYTILGFFLGWFGSLFQLSLTAQIVMQFAVIVFMLGTALNILEIHPIFRYFAIQPPKFITRKIRNQSKSKSVFAPTLLGAFTVFIPCGTTQAMMALAIGSGNPLLGAAILFAFVLGTTPLFFTLGYFATRLGETLQKRFMKVAAIVLILLAIFNLRNALGLAGVNLSLNSPSRAKQETNIAEVNNNPTIEFTSTGYTPANITIKAGASITLKLKNTSGSGCIQSFVIPSLNIQKVVQVGTVEQIAFIAPSDKTVLSFMCGMGMYRGVINVI